MTEFKQTNRFDCLPEQIQSMYIMKPYVCEYELTDETKEECEEYIDTTIEMWESIDEYPPLKFTKMQKNGKEVENTFYCNALCSHGKNCPYIKEFNDKREEHNKEEDDLSDIF